MRAKLKAMLDLARTSPGELALVCIAAAAVLSGSIFIFARSQTPAAPVIRQSVQKPRAEMIVVHVAGLVGRPGIYELKEGSRVHQAIEAAGGPLGEADLDSLNLASKLTDGQKIHLTKKGEPPPEQEGSVGGKTNLNTADLRKLEDLPGVGPVLAQRIIEFRQKKGGFTAVRDLLQVEGVGPKKYESLKDLVTV